MSDKGVVAVRAPPCDTTTKTHPNVIPCSGGCLGFCASCGLGSGQKGTVWWRRVKVIPTTRRSTATQSDRPVTGVREAEPQSGAPLVSCDYQGESPRLRFEEGSGIPGLPPVDSAKANVSKERSYEITPAVRPPSATPRPRTGPPLVDVCLADPPQSAEGRDDDLQSADPTRTDEGGNGILPEVWTPFATRVARRGLPLTSVGHVEQPRSSTGVDDGLQSANLAREDIPRKREDDILPDVQATSLTAVVRRGLESADSARAKERSYDTIPAVRAPFSTVAVARKHAEAEVDVMELIEEGQIFAATKAPVAKPKSAMTATKAVGAAIIASAGPVASGLVLPCPPSDTEKVIYLRTFRPYIIFFSFIAFVAMEAGMWLCTLASPYLFWLGVPAVIVFMYFVSYLAIATKGRDFVPEKHAEVLQNGAEQEFLPTVDVFLPVCNEPIELIANTWKYVSELDYPYATVHVLDDGAKDDVRDLAEAFGFRYKRRDNRPHMKKAGNLRHAFARTSGEAVVIFDADFCPRSDFLRETLPYLLDPSIGIVQTPQFFRWCKEQTWVEKGAGASQEFFYRMEQARMNRNYFGASVCVGSCAVYRRAAVEPFGGVAAIEHSEDIHTGCKITEAGFKVKYLPLCLAIGVCPDEPRSFFMQQYRWCAGNLSLVLRREFWMAEISAFQKICFLSGMLYYFFTAMFLFLAPLPVLILIWAKPNLVLWYHTGFTLPSIVFTTMVLPCWCRSFGCTSYTQRIWRAMSIYRIKVIQSYAHVYAIKDSLLGTSAAWVPSGGGASQKSCSGSYNSSVWLMLAWNALIVSLVLGGALVRMKESRPYDFVPAVSLVLSTTALSLSTLRY
eukprot:jgi/Undpi1/11824/HiC_scaffold_4.g01523.m1